MTIWIGGDVHLGHKGGATLSRLAPKLGGGIGIVNLEGPIRPSDVPEEDTSGSVSEHEISIAEPFLTRADAESSGSTSAQGERMLPRFRLSNSKSALEELAAARVKIAGIANNHAFDFGEEGHRATIRALRGAGIVPAGGAAGPALLESDDLRVAVTAHDLTNGLPDSLGEELREAKQTADFLLAMFHTTGPPSYLPSSTLVRAVEQAFAEGADVISRL
jgi:hypothetical protein